MLRGLKIVMWLGEYNDEGELTGSSKFSLYPAGGKYLLEWDQDDPNEIVPVKLTMPCTRSALSELRDRLD